MGQTYKFIRTSETTAIIQRKKADVFQLQEIPQQQQQLSTTSTAIQQELSTEIKVSHNAGNLKKVKEWCNITKDKFVLSCIRGYRIEFARQVYQVDPPKNLTFSTGT